MQVPVRTVARGAVLVAVAGLCLTTVVSGAFDVVSIPSPDAASLADGSGAVVGATGTGEPGGPAADAGPADGPAEAEGEDTEPGADAAPSGDPSCAAAQRAWNAAARAQVDLTVEHPDELVAGFASARDALVEVDPPPGVAHDWNVVRTYLTMIADSVEAAGPADRSELVRAIDRSGRHIDTAALASSSQNVTTYLQDGCPAA
ncbi:hypothetical protein IF650_04015 [Cellulosimicrobium terreum]|nr:hypothetical protein [Cellulosimicrobium terreum]